MTTAAVICEYNPFHNGHLYQLDKIREELNADYIVALMSGDYVERGEPAMFDKHLRAECALNQGADLVLMLPTVYSTGSAELFAYGAVSILNKLGCIDYLCFGAECTDLNEVLNCALAIYSNASIESPEIVNLLKEGYTYPKARAILLPQYENLLSGSNNILALEYINAIKKSGSTIKPHLIPRINTKYNDTQLDCSSKYASATAIRRAVSMGDDYSRFVPESVHKILGSSIPVYPDDFSMMLYYKLLSEDNFSDYLEVSEDLSLRISNTKNKYVSFTSYIEELKAKNFTYSRISRGLLHILLNIKGSNSDYLQMADNIRYVRMLGFRKSSAALLNSAKENGKITLISKIPDYIDKFNESDKFLFDTDLFASDIYDKIVGYKSKQCTPQEYTKQVIIK